MSKAALLALLLPLAACSGPGLDPRLEPLAAADLVPGRGLGDLVLGETTLRRFHERYGPGTVAAIFSDDFFALEVFLARGQWAFLFPIDAGWARSHLAALRDGARDPGALIAAHGEVASATLHSLSVRAARDPGDTHYRGQLPPGVRLGDPAETVTARLGPSQAGPVPLLAGTTPREPDGRHVDPERGVVVYLQRAPPEGGEQQPALVHRIVLYSPE